MSIQKHKDELLTDVAKTDPEYLEWLHENVNMREPMKTFVNELLKIKQIKLTFSIDIKSLRCYYNDTGKTN